MLEDRGGAYTTVGFDGYTCGGCRATYPSIYWFRERADDGQVRCLRCAPENWLPLAVDEPVANEEWDWRKLVEPWSWRRLGNGLWSTMTSVWLGYFQDRVMRELERFVDSGNNELLFWVLVAVVWSPVVANGARRLTRYARGRMPRMARADARRHRIGEGAYARTPGRPARTGSGADLPPAVTAGVPSSASSTPAVDSPPP